MEYIDQSIAELRLNLIKGSFNKKALNVLVTKELQVNGYDIELAIIGASHYCSIAKDKEMIFSEVFACVEMNEDFSALYKGDELKKIKKDDFGYIFESKIYKIDEEQKIIDRFHEDNILIFDFKGENGESAITGVRAKVVENYISLQTVHVYPNEGEFILTSSIFDLN